MDHNYSITVASDMSLFEPSEQMVCVALFYSVKQQLAASPEGATALQVILPTWFGAL